MPGEIGKRTSEAPGPDVRDFLSDFVGMTFHYQPDQEVRNLVLRSVSGLSRQATRFAIITGHGEIWYATCKPAKGSYA
jgi:hypothetical protein